MKKSKEKQKIEYNKKEYNLREDMSREDEKKLALEDTEAIYDYDEGEEAPGEEYDYKLNYSGKDIDIEGLVKRFNHGKIITPEFQRKFVWNKSRASRFIESLLLGIPSPEFFFYQKEDDGRMLVIDGFQRLSTLQAFYNEKFNNKSFKLNYPSIQARFKDITYNTLTNSQRTKLDYTSIHCTIVTAKEPKDRNYESIYHLFDRLNSGGMNLTPQEIRNCIFLKKDILKFIKQEEVSAFFEKDMKINALRGKHQEIALRVLALGMNLNNYNGNMNKFLNDFLDNQQITEEIKEQYKKTIHYIKKSINKEHFKQKTSKSNLAILDTIFVGIFKNIKTIENYDEEKINNIVKEMIQEESFKQFILYGRTHNSASMRGRIDFFLKRIDALHETR